MSRRMRVPLMLRVRAACHTTPACLPARAMVCRATRVRYAAMPFHGAHAPLFCLLRRPRHALSPLGRLMPMPRHGFAAFMPFV